MNPESVNKIDSNLEAVEGQRENPQKLFIKKDEAFISFSHKKTRKVQKITIYNLIGDNALSVKS
jgi:hypothetical protein